MTPPPLPEESLSDEKLIELIKEHAPNAEQAFFALVNRYQQWLVRLLSFLLSNQTDAEDVAQETFVKAYTAIPHYTHQHSFKAWLRVIATRQAYNFTRNRNTRLKYHDAAQHQQQTLHQVNRPYL